MFLQNKIIGGIKMKKKISIILGALLISSSIVAFAAGDYVNYSTTVGKFNGSGYTGYQTKTTTGAAAGVVSTTVGGNYTVDVRLQESNGTVGPWFGKLGDNQSAAITSVSEHKAGDSVRLQFSNDLTTRVDVQVDGKWRSN